jgi:hypothetical protein
MGPVVRGNVFLSPARPLVVPIPLASFHQILSLVLLYTAVASVFEDIAAPVIDM